MNVELMSAVRSIGGSKSNYRGILSITSDYLLIGLSVAIAIKTASPWWYLLCVVIVGSRMRALENLLHEGSHNHIHPNRRVNKWISMIFLAMPTGNSFSAYRKSHNSHHVHFASKTQDPDYLRYEQLGNLNISKSKLTRGLYILKILNPLFYLKYLKGTLSTFVYNNASPLHENILRIGFYTCLSVLLSLFNLWHYFLLFWIIPLCTSFQFIRYTAELSEHGGAYSEEDAMLMTRNNIYNRVISFLFYPHHDGYHLVHHLFPGISYYNLPKAHKILLTDENYKIAHSTNRFI
jgi:fatty acid desaturase